MNLTPVITTAAAPTLGDDTGHSLFVSGGDAEAVGMWLLARGSRSDHTGRTYSRISGRLMQWATGHQLTLASMTVADAQEHLEALRHPSSGWLIPRTSAGKLSDALYKSQTLKQPMSDKGLLYTRTVLGQLFHYLLTAGYVRRNVFLLTEKPSSIAIDPADKVLSHAACRHLWDWIATRQSESLQQADHEKQLEAARAKWICALLYYTGIRTIEAINGSMADFVRDTGGGWQLRVKGKGNLTRRVTVTDDLSRELLRFREAVGTRGWPPPNDTMPLIPHIRKNGQGSISDRMLRKIISELCKAAAQTCADPHVAAELQHTSPHWFRHTSATHRQEAGARLETTQQELGHADPKTTLLYAKIGSKARREDAELFAASVRLESK